MHPSSEEASIGVQKDDGSLMMFIMGVEKQQNAKAHFIISDSVCCFLRLINVDYFCVDGLSMLL